MDYISTPYTRDAFLDREGRIRVKLRWYPAPPGAKVFPGPHLFASGDWCEQAPEYAWPPPGEIKDSPRRFFDSRRLPPPPGDGQSFIGDLSWFQNGVPQSVLAAVACSGLPQPPNCNDRSPPLGGPRWGGAVAVCRMGSPSQARGGSSFAGSVNACVTNTRSLARGGTRWGGAVLPRPGSYPPAFPRGGTRWGGLDLWSYCCRPASPLGGTAWGGRVTWSGFPLVNPRGGGKWGGAVVPVVARHCCDCCGLDPDAPMNYRITGGGACDCAEVVGVMPATGGCSWNAMPTLCGATVGLTLRCDEGGGLMHSILDGCQPPDPVDLPVTEQRCNSGPYWACAGPYAAGLCCPGMGPPIPVLSIKYWQGAVEPAGCPEPGS